MGFIRGVIFLLVLVGGIGFAVLNDQAVSLRYHFGWESPPLPLFLWAFLFLLGGLIVAAIWALLSQWGLQSRIRRASKAIARLEKERDQLKEEEASA